MAWDCKPNGAAHLSLGNRRQQCEMAGSRLSGLVHRFNVNSTNMTEASSACPAGRIEDCRCCSRQQRRELYDDASKLLGRVAFERSRKCDYPRILRNAALYDGETDTIFKGDFSTSGSSGNTTKELELTLKSLEEQLVGLQQQSRCLALGWSLSSLKLVRCPPGAQQHQILYGGGVSRQFHLLR